jgi:dTDP-4-dehydrorhamnose reductase
MRILITGANGQLGLALQGTLADHELLAADLPEVDITKREDVRQAICGNRLDLVIHCAAYTDVDGCARNPELAYRVNAYGTQNVALACLSAGIPLAHISTNEVFSGDHPQGYEEWMPMAPRNPYGRSKAAAEAHIQGLLSRYYIIRTAWLFAPGGHNFIHTILSLARKSSSIRTVTDEIGNPTYALDLSQAIARLVTTGQFGIYHLVNSGACSRWAFANETLRLAGLGRVANTPILSGQYTRPSSPPPFGTLINRNGAAIGIRLRPWQEALADYFQNELSS